MRRSDLGGDQISLKVIVPLIGAMYPLAELRETVPQGG